MEAAESNSERFVRAQSYAKRVLDDCGIWGDLRIQLIEELRESALGKAEFDWERLRQLAQAPLVREHEFYEEWQELRRESGADQGPE